MSAEAGQIVIQRCVSPAGIPSASSLRAFAQAALPRRHGELTIRIVDADESRTFNREYRGKDKPTNVLSFDGDGEVLGDLVICAPVVAQEALEQGKPARAHWAHMVVHGCLHLQGYDHEHDADATRMEAREIRILKTLGFKDPYQ
ncbi:rRNA maturation RNase YbeY [Sinimarinibacterium sp. CAU 1509]|uniref:rRNA maturation RNase YbeY n=1 Tax=Sinimarinibacterium sp. CAU 1509 TaxID=2562283 RepID=UPI0010AC5923|nr:rRNA maturation RNase YbeY [Sinimarinibacterium sp. CAU 1509]TJY56768.1 rRNA maturation RNase YbeY [Sinimarinibacterium sp. CAU 1509]